DRSDRTNRLLSQFFRHRRRLPKLQALRKRGKKGTCSQTRRTSLKPPHVGNSLLLYCPPTSFLLTPCVQRVHSPHAQGFPRRSTGVVGCPGTPNRCRSGL